MSDAEVAERGAELAEEGAAGAAGEFAEWALVDRKQSKESMASARSGKSSGEAREEAAEVHVEREVVEIVGGPPTETIGDLEDADVGGGCPLLRKWWFWTGLLLLLGAGVVTGAVLGFGSGDSVDKASFGTTMMATTGAPEVALDDAVQQANGGADDLAVMDSDDNGEVGVDGEQVIETEYVAATVPKGRTYINIVLKKTTFDKVDHTAIPQTGYWNLLTDISAVAVLVLAMSLFCWCFCCAHEKKANFDGSRTGVLTVSAPPGRRN